MAKLAVTDFSKRTGSPFKSSSPETEEYPVFTEEVVQKVHQEMQKEKRSELIEKVNKKTAEIQSHKPPCNEGFFTEVVTHGAFTSKTNGNNGSEATNKILPKPSANKTNNGNGLNGAKNLLGFPSSANDLALDAKSDLESDPNISKEVKEKVIEKLFALSSIAQHIYESKVRIMTEFEKYKDTHMKNDARREKEHSEQLYKLSMNFQTELVQAIQQLKSELDIARNVSKAVEINGNRDTNTSVEFNTSEISNKSAIASTVDDCDTDTN